MGLRGGRELRHLPSSFDHAATLQTADHLPVLVSLPASLQWRKLLSIAWQHQLFNWHCAKSLQTRLMLLDKACQKLRGIPDVPPQRITDLENTTRQLRQLSCILDSCTISASYEVNQAQKALLLMPRTAKGASTSEELTHRCHYQQMMNIMPFKIKTNSKNTRLRKMVNIMHPAKKTNPKTKCENCVTSVVRWIHLIFSALEEVNLVFTLMVSSTVMVDIVFARFVFCTFYWRWRNPTTIYFSSSLSTLIARRTLWGFEFV